MPNLQTFSTARLYQSPRTCANAVAHANLSKCTIQYITLAEQVIIHICIIYYISQKNTLHKQLHITCMKLHCIYCENLIQLGAGAHAIHVQPIITRKEHDIVCKNSVRNAKITEVKFRETLLYQAIFNNQYLVN